MKKSLAMCVWCWVLVPLCAPAVAQPADILLDPGHGPRRYGATSCSGGREYAYNNALAATVRDYLAARGIAADLTRAPEQDISLAARAALSQGRRLLISLHHDSAQEQFITPINGHPCSEKARGYSIFVSRKNPCADASVDVALRLGHTLRAMGLVPSTHHAEPIAGENRQPVSLELGVYYHDDLVVLKQARCPALLLEAAVIIHPEDDALARDVRYQQLFGQALALVIAGLPRAR